MDYYIIEPKGPPELVEKLKGFDKILSNTILNLKTIVKDIHSFLKEKYPNRNEIVRNENRLLFFGEKGLLFTIEGYSDFIDLVNETNRISIDNLIFILKKDVPTLIEKLENE